ncbi:unnamed protein product [Porites evermanni]|uniref:Ribosomal protein S7 n=1 Tax=Porites evermanni TaxID=104178 RepID=A0ABN8T3X1_9CNID|nr:unnamed protein product [Porites evermanni]
MKRKIDFVEEEHESEHEESESSGDESEDEEPIIKDVLSHLPRAVSVKRAPELLHSMAASKDLLFWTPRGQLLRNKRIIPVANIAELLEYVVLPYNDDVSKPRALNTFLDGLAELGIDKGLIKNKRLLIDLIEKEKGYQNVKIRPITRVITRRVHRILKIRKRRRNWLLRMALKLRAPRRATTTLKTTVRKQKVVALRRPPPFTLKVHVNIAKTLMCTRH